MAGSSQQKGLKNSKFASSSHKQEEQLAKLFGKFLVHVTLSGHILEEEGNKEPSLFNRAVSEQLSSVNKETLKEVKSDTQSGTVPCRQLLHFLQRNIVIAVVAVAGILVILVVLLLMLTMYTRKKQALYPPANMTYNIFIMNGKAWWQKSQEKNSKKYSGKQKQLNCDSCV
ncbi:uncharacterized protein C2orf92 homolog [Pteronotus mesoamericanus]|uniref:uncharacterized protein C2orf92 homolog n=1 Tax=Pteronotus mesoamericanus TaxID=1884717 RepID=UPI0023EE0E29|nr:uncharacterized protein C2orf92 homolog [Pteronotus parnellii mesoamericanus]